MVKVSVTKGDITRIKVDAIVNAANTSLLGGGGVDGAIHRAAGPELLEACRKLNGCRTGEAKITSGFALPARYVIYTVGPVWHGGGNNEEQLLYNAYYNSLKLAMDHSVKTIAFPNISTGVYGFPKELAGETATRAVRDFCNMYPEAFDEVMFVCFDEENLEIYKSLL
jgi:O-acetyl-ADP-ribose deacetylase